MKSWRIVPVLAVFTLAAAACAKPASDAGLVARAGSHELTVDQVVQLLQDQEQLPAQREVIQTLADLWINYTLLADEAARDSTFQSIELEPLVRMQLDQETLMQFGDSAIPVDTAITETELRQLYERQAPSARLRARHILLTYPPQATQAQRDSVRAELESIRKRAVAGESFAALARRYSQDTGNAKKGGDLGEFGRGDLVPALENAAFKLQPGQISPIVESPFGLHIVKLEAKIIPPFDSVRDQYREQIQQERMIAAESTYVAGLEAKASPKIAEDAVDLVRQVASAPAERLTSRAQQRALITYPGGSYTVGQFQELVQTRNDQWRASVKAATDEQIDGYLHTLAQRELMLDKARQAGMAPSQARVDSLVEQTRGQITRIAGEIGVLHFDRAPGESMDPAVDRAVSSALKDVLSGAKGVVPLGPIAFQLRERTQTEVYDAGVGEALLRIGAIRAGRHPSPAEGQADTSVSTPDSTGR